MERFEKYGPYLFTYLDQPDVMPFNNAWEREIHPFMVRRKTSGTFINLKMTIMYAKHLFLFVLFLIV
ncbi:MAG: IS66 family transposase [Promethearchaeota archaeon]